MVRIILDELPNYEFSYSLTVRATDINYAGHLGNEALLGLIHEARSQFLRALNFDTIVGKNQRVGLIIADLAVNFKAEAFARDQLTIDCQIGEISEKSFRLFHRVRREAQVIAVVETGMVAFDYQAETVTTLPDDFMSGLQEFRY
jgi:acyl-CoA thioesterase FadM